jgi:hypothetical protein
MSKSINPKLILTVSHGLVDDIDFGTARVAKYGPSLGEAEAAEGLLCQTIGTTEL